MHWILSQNSLGCLPNHLPNIIQPSQHTRHSKILMDNNLCHLERNNFGNITTNISDKLQQLLILPNTFVDPLSNKSNVF